MKKIEEDACNLPKTVFSIRDLYPFLENVYNLAPGKILIYLILSRIFSIIHQKSMFISKFNYFIPLDDPAAYQMSSSSGDRRVLPETLLRRTRIKEVLFHITLWIMAYKAEYLRFI